jgi:hypothetical protein
MLNVIDEFTHECDCGAGLSRSTIRRPARACLVSCWMKRLAPIGNPIQRVALAPAQCRHSDFWADTLIHYSRAAIL